MIGMLIEFGELDMAIEEEHSSEHERIVDIDRLERALVMGDMRRNLDGHGELVAADREVKLHPIRILGVE